MEANSLIKLAEFLLCLFFPGLVVLFWIIFTMIASRMGKQVDEVKKDYGN